MNIYTDTAIGTSDNQLHTCSVVLCLCLAWIASLTEREHILQKQACAFGATKGGAEVDVGHSSNFAFALKELLLCFQRI